MEKNLINIQSSQVWNTFNTAVFALCIFRPLIFVIKGLWVWQKTGWKDLLTSTEFMLSDILKLYDVLWNTLLYIHFVNYEKAFDSLDWLKLLRHPQKPVCLIHNKGMPCRVVHSAREKEEWDNPVLLVLVNDGIMKSTASSKRDPVDTLWLTLSSCNYTYSTPATKNLFGLMLRTLSCALAARWIRRWNKWWCEEQKSPAPLFG